MSEVAATIGITPNAQTTIRLSADDGQLQLEDRSAIVGDVAGSNSARIATESSADGHQLNRVQHETKLKDNDQGVMSDNFDKNSMAGNIGNESKTEVEQETKRTAENEANREIDEETETNSEANEEKETNSEADEENKTNSEVDEEKETNSEADEEDNNNANWTILLETEHLAVQAKDLYQPLEVTTEVVAEDELLLVPRTMSFLTIPSKASALQHLSSDVENSGSAFYALQSLSVGQQVIASGLEQKQHSDVGVKPPPQRIRIKDIANRNVTPLFTKPDNCTALYLWVKLSFHDITRQHKVIVRYGSELQQSITWNLNRIGSPTSWHWQLCPIPLYIEATGCKLQIVHCVLGTKLLSYWTTIQQDRFPPNYESCASHNRMHRDKILQDMPWDECVAHQSAEKRLEAWRYKQYVLGRRPPSNKPGLNGRKDSFIPPIRMDKRTMFVYRDDPFVAKDDNLVIAFAPDYELSSEYSDSSSESDVSLTDDDMLNNFSMAFQGNNSRSLGKSQSLARAALKFDFEFETKRRGIEMQREERQMRTNPLKSLARRRYSMDGKTKALHVDQLALDSVFAQVNEISGALKASPTGKRNVGAFPESSSEEDEVQIVGDQEIESKTAAVHQSDVTSHSYKSTSSEISFINQSEVKSHS